MRQRCWRLAWLALAVAVMGTSVGIPVLGGAPCGCDRVEISGAGYAEVNGTYRYRANVRLADGSGMMRFWIGPSSNLVQGQPFQWAIVDTFEGWYFMLVIEDSPIGNPQPCTQDCIAFVFPDAAYQNSARSFCPPETGWKKGRSPAPTLSLDHCSPPVPISLIVVPTGLAGPGEFLDVVLQSEDDTDPPMIGTLPLVAIHTVGDVVTGSCVIQDPTGSPLRSTYIHIYVYAVDASERPEVLQLSDHWTVTRNVAGDNYEFSWDTAGFSAGDYNLRLSFENETAENFGIQLIDPPE